MAKYINISTPFSPHFPIWRKGLFIASISLCSVSFCTFAQYNPSYPSNCIEMSRAKEMLKSKNYQAVIDEISQLLLNNPGNNNLNLLSSQKEDDAAYLLALGCYFQDYPQTLMRLQSFIELYPESEYTTQVLLAQADYLFFNEDYADALKVYDTIFAQSLSPQLRAQYTYRKALCMLHRGYVAEARPLFAALATDAHYANAALYYDAYIDYVEGDLNSAYEKFSKVTEPESPGSPRRQMPAKNAYISQGLEPGYYLTQIEYARGEYDDVITHGKALLQRRRVAQLAPDIDRIIGLSYFKKGMLSNARGYLEKYFDAISREGLTPVVSAAADARYAMGCILFEKGEYEEATNYFSSLTDLNNALSQSAYLYLGQCLAHEHDESAAALAFDNAAKMNFDVKVGETARYNLIVARLNGGNIPFSSSISMLEKFLADYPDSKFSADANELLAAAYYNEKDYSHALQSINRISNPSKKVREVKQKILFQLGVSLVSNSKSAEAIPYLREASSQTQPDSKISRQAALWLGDALYATHDYAAATKEYQRALKSISGDSNQTLTLYNLAYSQYMSDNFEGAEKSFAQALKSSTPLPDALYTDALIRRADCLSYLGKYPLAEALYQEAGKRSANDADYIAYRKAMLQGAQGNITAKLEQLDNFILKYPDSKWAPDALLEAANTYVAEGNFSKAANIYESILSRFPSKAQARKATYLLAYSYASLGDADKAIDAYKNLIATWPSSEEALQAIGELQRICAANNRLNDYITFAQTTPGLPALSSEDVEKLSFDAASEALIDSTNNILPMENYIKQFPNGVYLSNALLDLGRYYSLKNNYSKAIELLSQLLDKRPDSQQATEANILLAEALEAQYPDKPQRALASWQMLEKRGDVTVLPYAYAGVMRTTPDAAQRIEYARKLQTSGAPSAEDLQEAYFYEADGLMKSGKAAEAVKIFKQLADNPLSLAGSKASVALGEYYLKAKQYKNAEKTLVTFTESATPHIYWLAKGFIALADTYKASGKKYLAVDYLESLKDNYPGNDADIFAEINKRLKAWK